MFGRSLRSGHQRSGKPRGTPSSNMQGCNTEANDVEEDENINSRSDVEI